MESTNRREVLVQWIQRLICDAMSSGVIPIAPPVISRVFQELSRGMVNFSNVKKIKEFPFPFPYMQMINLLLVLQVILTPIANCFLVENLMWATILSFVSVFAYWSINYIACE